MIELGHIRLAHTAAAYDARKKVRNLAAALGYPTIETTRLAIAVSEAARIMQQTCRAPRIFVSLDTESARGRLVLDFVDRGSAPALHTLDGFFDKTAKCRIGDFQGTRATQRLPRAGFEATDIFVKEQSAQIQAKSREELMDEIQQKNVALEEHSARLEYTVAQRTEELKQAIKRVEASSENYVARRMNASVQKVLSGKNINQVDM